MIGFLAYSRPSIPVFLGLCIGIALSLILVPLLEEKCQFPSPQPKNFISVPSSQSPSIQNVDRAAKEVKLPSVTPSQPKTTTAPRDPGVKSPAFPQDGTFNYDDWLSDDYEPERKIFDQTPPAAASKPTLRRPRYISTELGIRESLFVGVLTSKVKLESNAVAVNRTLNGYVPKLVFFLEARGPTLPAGMSLVIFSDEKPYLMPLHMIKYISDHYLKAYDWFYFMFDTTYVRGEKLMRLVEGMSAENEIYLGRPLPPGVDSFCDIRSGILLSHSFLRKVVQQLDWCIKMAHPGINDNENIRKCIEHSTQIRCSRKVDGESYPAFHAYDFDFQADSEALMTDPTFKNALSVSEVHSDMDMFRLHRFYCEEDMKEAGENLERLKKEIADISPLAPDANQTMQWPVGVDPPNIPSSRFDVIAWQYFTEKEILLDNAFSNSKPLQGADKEDVQDVIKVAMTQLVSRYDQKYAYKSLVNGYRRFDATRGMDYILDLLLFDNESQMEIQKRVFLMRPLGAVEIVPMPYVTENVRVNLVLPVTMEDSNGVVSLLDSFAEICLESGDNSHLFIVFVYESSPSGKMAQDDPYAVLKSMIAFYENKYHNGAKISWSAIHHSSSPLTFSIMDMAARRFSPESLLLLSTSEMELSIDFLNRARMNSIPKHQVFFPIGFRQYKPNLIHPEKPFPTTITIKKGMGHYDVHSYDIAAFYNMDYHSARKQMITASPSQIDLYDMFLKYHNVHVLRAVEPALKLHFRVKECGPEMTEEAYSRCLAGRAEGLASQSQLAMLIFEHQQKLDQSQLDVMHQQNGQNVEQIKPDMLRK